MPDYVVIIRSGDGIDTRELTAPDDTQAQALADGLFDDVLAVEDVNVADVPCGCSG